MSTLIKINFKYKNIITFLVVCFSLWGFSLAPKIAINLSLSNLLPDNNSSVIEMKQAAKEIGGMGYLMIFIGPTNHPEQFLKEVEQEIKDYPSIHYLFYEKNEYLLRNKSFFILPKDKFKKLSKNAKIIFRKGKGSMLNLGLEDDQSENNEKVKKARAYLKKFNKDSKTQRYYVSKDKRYALLFVKPNFESVDLEKSTKLINKVSMNLTKILKKTPYHLFGRYVSKVRDSKQIQKDITKTGLISGFLIMFILITGLGSFRAALFTLSGIIISLGWTIFFAYHFVGQINILTGFLLAILSGLGADYGIHLIRRFYEESAIINNSKVKNININVNVNVNKQALTITYNKTGRALFSSALTTAIAFLCLIISDFRGFSELGIIAGMGVLSIFIVFMLIFPFFGSFLAKDLRFNKVAKIYSFYPFKLKSFKFIIIFIPIIIFGLKNVEFEYNFKRMRGISLEMLKLDSLADKVYGKTTSPSAMIAKDRKEAAKVAKWLKQKKFSPVIDKVISLNTVLPLKMKSRYRKIKKLKKLISNISDQELEKETSINANKIRNWLNVKPYTRKDLPQNVRTVFGKKGNIILTYPRYGLDTRDKIMEFANILNAVKKEFPNVKIGSDTLVFVQILDHIITDGKFILLLFLVGSFITFMIDFKSVKSAIILETQIILGILLLVAFMGMFDIRFTILNIAIFPAILATGIDMAVHIRHRELEGNKPLKSSSISAQAINLSMITTLVGFASLFIAEAKLLIGIAWIAILGLIGMYLICMYIIPVSQSYFLKKKGT